MHTPPSSREPAEEFHSLTTCAAVRARDERLEVLKAFAGKLAHDFRNTLVPQLGYVTLIKELTGEDAAILPYISKLENSTRKLEAYLDAILLAVRPERRFVPRTCDFAALVNRVLDAWIARLPKDAAIQMEASLGPCTLTVDESHWAVAIEQLLKNAQFALAGGGRLTVALQARTLTQEQTANLNLRATELFQLVVKDNGFGMNESVLQRACEPFFTTRPKGQAAGLGLTTVQSVVRLHGGRLVLESAEDAGTTVTIWLPVLERGSLDVQPALAKVSAGSAERKSGAKILLIESDPVLLEVIKIHVRSAPIEILTAQDGHEGLKLFQRHAAELSLVVSNAALPGMSGFEICSRIRHLDARVPMILISSDPNADQEKNWVEMKSPRPALVKKPFALKTLSETILAAIRQAG